ncbi:MAG TPA: hypothetical protein VNZ61_16610 [Roseomonas sp.]|nr:hypothetical protein [Roseomonas sp.]
MTVLINAAALTDDALIRYDIMMVEAITKIRNLSALADSIWVEVLKELDVRGRVRLVHGSYDDIGNALIQRLDYPSPQH